MTTPSTPPRGNLLRPEWLSVQLCRQAPTTLFLFGDNMLGRGQKGQAVIRYEPNALGVPTKYVPGREESHYFTDAAADDPVVVARLSAAFRTARERLAAGHDVAIAAGGLGTDLAQLPQRAPRVFNMICKAIQKLEALSRGEIV